MKLAVICSRSFGGGAERATLIWARQMRAAGNDILWLCDDEFAKETSESLSNDVGVEVFGVSSIDLAGRREVIVRLLREKKCEICLLPDHWRDIFADDLQSVAQIGVKTVVCEHSMFYYPLHEGRFDLWRTRKEAYRKADAIVVLSPENVAWWRSVGFMNTAFIPNYCSVRAYNNEETRKKGSLLFCGRICPLKGVDLLIEALGAIQRSTSGKEVSLTLVGRFETEDYRLKLKARVRELGLEERVNFVGETSNVNDYYQQAWLLVMASRLEGLPMVVNEARAAGVPTVAFELPYVACFDENHGVETVPQGDVQALADRILGLLNNEDEYRRLSQAAVSTLQLFTDDSITQRWCNLFRQLKMSDSVEAMCEIPQDADMFAMTQRVLDWMFTHIDSVKSLRREIIKAHRSNELREAELNLEIDRLRRCVSEMEVSWSYKLGRMITWPIRKICKRRG